jgi:uncharacterized protein (DUF2141 family)
MRKQIAGQSRRRLWTNPTKSLRNKSMNLPRRIRAAVIATTAVMGLSAAAPAMGQAGPPAGCQGTPSATWLNVVVEGVRNGDGLIAVTLYADDSRKFLAKKGSLKVSRFDAVAPTTRTCIFVPQPGVYAIAVYHDEDGSRKINRSALGIPSEGFGFSNNPTTVAGIPAFRSVRLDVPKAGLTTRIRLRYP